MVAVPNIKLHCNDFLLSSPKETEFASLFAVSVETDIHWPSVHHTFNFKGLPLKEALVFTALQRVKNSDYFSQEEHNR